MEYRGTRLRDYVKYTLGAGGHKEISTKLAAKYGRKTYNLNGAFKDGTNLTLKSLTDLLWATGLTVDEVVDFEPGEWPRTGNSGKVTGNNNIINSSVSSDMALKIDHLNEVIRLKDEIIEEKVNVIASKDELIDELQGLKKKYDDLLELVKNKNTL